MDTPQGSQPSKKRKEISPLAADRHIDLAMFMLKEVTAMVSSLTSTSSDPAIAEQTKQITHKLGWITASIERTDYMRDLLHESDHRENEILVEQNRDLREQAQTAQGLQTDLIESLHRENELLIEQNRSLRDQITIAARSQGPQSYAAAAFSANPGTKITKALPRPAFKSTTVRHESQTAAETAKLIKQKLNPLQRKVKASLERP